MSVHHSPPRTPDPEDEPTVPTVHDLRFRSDVDPAVQVRVLAIVVLTLVLMAAALWMAMGTHQARLRVEDPTGSHD